MWVTRGAGDGEAVAAGFLPTLQVSQQIVAMLRKNLDVYA